MIKAKIIGACGFGGVGMVELLRAHPQAEASILVDVENQGKQLSELYPHLQEFCDLTITDPEDVKALEHTDIVFTATPDRVGMQLAKDEIKRGAKVIDYSGDFRFENSDAYADYARRIGLAPEHLAPELLSQSSYGLPELHRSQILNSAIAGNPGCFAVSCILGLAPAAKERLLNLSSIICDCKTGVSGAGRKAKETFHYPARYDNMNAYRLSGHQHVCEIERELSILAGDNVTITFTAQVVPVCRGIMSTLYGSLENGITSQEITEIYRDFYKDEPFVRVCESNATVGSVHVRGTNYCNLVVSVDERNNRLRIVSYIDNLVKGQAGNALQNMNLMFGLPETTGLDKPGIYP